MSVKELAIQSIEDLPDETSFEEIEERIHFLAAIERARREASRGETVPHETVRDRLQQWLTE
jgi:predicted transcriptional regulator